MGHWSGRPAFWPGDSMWALNQKKALVSITRSLPFSGPHC